MPTVNRRPQNKKGENAKNQVQNDSSPFGNGLDFFGNTAVYRSQHQQQHRQQHNRKK